MSGSVDPVKVQVLVDLAVALDYTVDDDRSPTARLPVLGVFPV